MTTATDFAIAQLRQWAHAEDPRRRDGGWGGRAAVRAALWRKCAHELAGCGGEPAAAREVLCRYAVTARDDVALRLNALAATLGHAGGAGAA
ncbi:MAG: hypothetical protein EXR83_15910 [Gammaproteobacteria bacterium]|nr:hypothetical protein [Gammaproteobacteria bacterium]